MSRALLVVVVLGFLGCRSPEPVSLIRLVDRAESAVIVESPLLSQSTAGEPAAARVWHSDFEGDVLAELGWPDWGRGAAGAWLDQDAEHGQVVCVGADSSEPFSILLPVRPQTRYRISRLLRTDWPDFDLRIAESAARLRRGPGQDSAAAVRAATAKGALLAVHRFAAASDAWSLATVDLLTNLDARVLAVGFERVADASRPLSTAACLAELTIERLDPDPAQALELQRSAGAAADGRAGDWVKRGRLLPLRRLKNSRPPFDDNYSVRDALFAPAPTRMRFPVRLPAGARFSFAYGLSAGSRSGDEVEFEVVVERGGEGETVFRQTAVLGRRGGGWHWTEANVDLARWEGDDVVLELRTSSTTARGFGLWADPVIDSPRRVEDPPNLVLIGIDTLRADRLGAYGHDRPTSPNLDRLAADGVLFKRAISASNWTAPSFASIFTGLATASHGVVNEEFRMHAAVDTLTERLRDGGWRTHAVVYKAALFGLGLDQGFDRWLNLPTSNRVAQDNLDRALAMLDRDGDRRFFLFLHLDDPHQPFNQPAPFDERFGDAETRRRLGVELPISIRNSAINGCERCLVDGQPSDEFVREAQALYDAAVAYTDDRIGVLIEALRERGLYDNTVIAVVADHGEVIYDRFRLWGHGALLMADEMVHVPMIVKPAAGTGAGKMIEGQVRTTDLMPTLLQAVGLEPPEGPDARSLWPLIASVGVPDAADRVAFFENPQRRVVGLRSPDWKYVVRSHGGRSYPQLYDLRTDPGELVNVALERGGDRARLDERLTQFILRTREGPFLLIVGDGVAADYQLTVERDEGVELRSLLGLLPTDFTTDDTSPFPGGGRVLALLQFDLEAGMSLSVTLRPGDGTPARAATTLTELFPYDPSSWARLVATPGIYFLRGPSQVGARRVGPPSNVDQVEDLRDLGYID